MSTPEELVSLARCFACIPREAQDAALIEALSHAEVTPQNIVFGNPDADIVFGNPDTDEVFGHP